MSTLSRRELLQALSCVSLAATGVGGLSFAATRARSTLVVVFLRGGADALQMLAPVDDKNYVQARPAELRVLADGDKPGIRLPKGLSDADWRMHAAAAPLADLLQSGHAQVLHACGLGTATRSHFEAQEVLESSAVRALNASPGWLAPYVTKGSMLGAVGASNGQIRALSGVTDSLNFGGELRQGLSLPWDEQGRKVLEVLYSTPTGVVPDALQALGQQTLGLLGALDAKLPRVDGRTQAYAPPAGVRYNSENGEWFQACQTVAQLVRMDVGLQVACLDFGGWDTHEGQSGRMNNQVRQWAANVRALFDDLSASGRPATLVVVSEFGRRLKANASGGTDHGHGGALWLFDTAGRKLLPATKWPGLSIPELDQGLDLKSTTDVKSVLAGVAKAL